MDEKEQEFIFSLRCANCDLAPTIAEIKYGKIFNGCEKAYTKDSVGCEKYDHNKLKIVE